MMTKNNFPWILLLESIALFTACVCFIYDLETETYGGAVVFVYIICVIIGIMRLELKKEDKKK